MKPENNLDYLFFPRSIAVIGASTDIGSVGNDIARNLISCNYTGEVYFINPKTKILFERHCYISIKEIYKDIDLAIIIVPASIVSAVLREAGEKKVRAVIIISAGFKESGRDGEKREQEIIAIAKEFDITLLGPNCLGILIPRLSLNASFASFVPTKGNIAFLSQSGALLTSLLDATNDILQYSAVVSTGNKALLNENNLFKYFLHDTETKVIGAYVESLENAQDFLNLNSDKPIIILKSGTTPNGTLASKSHTGALAGTDRAYTSLCEQSNFIRAKNFREFINLLEIFSLSPLPQNSQVAIITNAGGMGVLATDACVENNLDIAPLAPKTKNFLINNLPPASNTHNPIDILGDARASRYALAVKTAANDPNVGNLLIILTPQTMTESEATAKEITKIKKTFPEKPLATVFAGGSSVTSGKKILREYGIPVFETPEEAASALGNLAKFAKNKKIGAKKITAFPSVKKNVAKEIFERARKEKREWLTESESYIILEAYGLNIVKNFFAASPEHALKIINSFFEKKLVAMKIVSPNIIHKSDANGVLLNIDPLNIYSAYNKLMNNVSLKRPDAKLEGVLITEMADIGGLEIILGIKKEPYLGSVIMVGLGGIFTEIFNDTSLRFAPLTKTDAHAMLNELKSLPILNGARGKRAIDIDYLAEYLERLSLLAMDFPEIEELDINPLMVFSEKEKFKVLDARIKIVPSTIF